MQLVIDGLKFEVETGHDECIGTPWEEHDGHGIVTDWVRRDKRPGERILIADRDHKRYYDIQASMEIALRDSWGCENPEGKTRHQIAAEAVEADFQRLRAWCNDQWHWMFVSVQLLSKDGTPVPDFQSVIGGIESDCGDEYIEETARDLASELSARVGDQTEICIPVR